MVLSKEFAFKRTKGDAASTLRPFWLVFVMVCASLKELIQLGLIISFKVVKYTIE